VERLVILEKLVVVADLFVPEGTPTREGGGEGGLCGNYVLVLSYLMICQKKALIRLSLD
jgi:hypothetical protein